MNLILTRKIFTSNSSIGSLTIEGQEVPICVTLEPIDKGLTSDMPLDKIKSIKVTGKTAIPYGKYKIAMLFSPKHNRVLPHYLNVPGFEEIEMHIGNYPADTEGCTLCAKEIGGVPDMISNSKDWLNDNVYPIISAACQSEEVWITITK